MTDSIICPKCSKVDQISVTVDATIVGGVDLWGNVTKGMIRTKEVQIVAANWPGAHVYCHRCKYFIISPWRGD